MLKKLNTHRPIWITQMLWKLIAVATQTLHKHLSPKSFLELIY